MRNTIDKTITIADIKEKAGKSGKYFSIKDTRGNFYNLFRPKGISDSKFNSIINEFQVDDTCTVTLEESEFNGKTYYNIVGRVDDIVNQGEPEKTFDQIKQENISRGQSWNLGVQVALSVDLPGGTADTLKQTIKFWQEWFEKELNS